MGDSSEGGATPFYSIVSPFRINLVPHHLAEGSGGNSLRSDDIMLFDKRRNNQFFHSLMRQVIESVLSVTFQKTDLIQIADTRLILKENCSLASIGITSFVIFPTKRAFAFLKFSFSGIHTEIWKIIYFLFSCKFRFHFRNVFCFLNLCIRILFEIRKIVYFHFSFAIALSFFRIRFAFLFQRKNFFWQMPAYWGIRKSDAVIWFSGAGSSFENLSQLFHSFFCCFK